MGARATPGASRRHPVAGPISICHPPSLASGLLPNHKSNFGTKRMVWPGQFFSNGFMKSCVITCPESHQWRSPVGTARPPSRSPPTGSGSPAALGKPAGGLQRLPLPFQLHSDLNTSGKTCPENTEGSGQKSTFLSVSYVSPLLRKDICSFITNKKKKTSRKLEK